MKRSARSIVALMLAVLAGVLVVVGHGSPVRAADRTTSAVSAHSAAAPGRSSCPKGTPSDAYCVTIPAKCPPILQPCPEVIAQPTTNLANSQSVYLTLENFWNTSDIVRVEYCQNLKPLSKTYAPLCDDTGIGEMPNPQEFLEPYPNTGSVSYSFQVLYVAKGSTPLSAVVPGTKTFGSFLCDSTSPCAIDVTDPFLGPNGSAGNITPNTQNTAVIPVSFASASAGCPRATFLDTESEFGIDSLLQSTAQATCSGSNPVADTNLDVDAPSAVNSFAQGSFPLVFTDSPASPDEQAALETMKGKYALIPVALSANVMAFLADVVSSHGYPDTTFKLTPNMAAGIFTNQYATSYGSDFASCPWMRGSARRCPLVETLNPVVGFSPPISYGSYVRGDTSSPTYAVFNWVCNAPRVPVKIGSHRVLEPTTVTQVLDRAWILNHLTPPKSCPATLDQFPTFNYDIPNFGTASTPATQVTKLQSFVPLPQNASGAPPAGFADMSYADALQWGLSIAQLQNAAGNFVLPSSAALEASASALRLGSNGIYSYDYATTNKAAYPMPDVWYALVSTAPQSQQAVTAERGLLDNILQVSGGDLTTDLPPGYAPLPKAITQAALADVTKDITVQGSSGSTTTTTTVPTAPPPTTPGGVTPSTTATSSNPTGGSTHSSGGNGHTASGPGSKGSRTPSGGGHKAPEQLPAQLATFTLTGRSGSWLVALMASLLAAGLIFGPGLIYAGRRRVRKGAGDGGS